MSIDSFSSDMMPTREAANLNVNSGNAWGGALGRVSSTGGNVNFNDNRTTLSRGSGVRRNSNVQIIDKVLKMADNNNDNEEIIEINYDPLQFYL